MLKVEVNKNRVYENTCILFTLFTIDNNTTDVIFYFWKYSLIYYNSKYT